MPANTLFRTYLASLTSRGGRKTNSQRDCRPAFANQISLRCSLNSHEVSSKEESPR